MIRLTSLIFITILFKVSLASAISQSCLELFQSNKVERGSSSCIAACTTVKLDMSNFTCHDQCDEYCKTDCQTFKTEAEKKLKNGVPPQWLLKEKTSLWTHDQKSLAAEAISEIPDVLLSFSGWKIYRLQKAIDFPNPASSINTDPPSTVLYDNAFSGKYVLSRIMAHELAHFYYQNLSNADASAYRSMTNWFPADHFGKKWISRKDGFVEEDGKTSPEEDFANNVEYYLFDPQKLKKVTPYAYRWIEENMKNLKLKKGCHYEK